jgi:group II intron reverse transcriptase/maturase
MPGIPTVVDRLIRQAVHQELGPLFEPGFSASSYGFRPGKSARQAVQAARKAVSEGLRWVVDLDLAKFFDRVNHDILMSRVAGKVKDKRVLHLIRSYLQAGLFEGGIISPRQEGTPQGGPLSPLLSNILLDEPDKEPERRNHTFCRYADDCAPRTHRGTQVPRYGAARKMRDGPSEPAYRSRVQTTSSCIGKEPL